MKETKHGSPELGEDARNLEAMGADPGLSLQDFVVEDEISYIQINALVEGKWGWVVWFGGDDHPLDQEGISESLSEALTAVKKVVDG